MRDPYAAPVVEHKWENVDPYIECGLVVLKTSTGVPVAKLTEDFLTKALADLQEYKRGL